MANVDQAGTSPDDRIRDRIRDRLAMGGALRRWAAEEVAVVRVVERHGFGPVEQGQLAVVGPDDQVVGRLLHDVQPGAVAALGRSAVAEPRVEQVEVDAQDAVRAGLTCGGGATLLGHPLAADEAEALGAAFEARQPVALVATTDGAAHLVVDGPSLDRSVGGLGSAAVDAAAREAVQQLQRRGTTTTEVVTVTPEGADEPVPLLVDLWVPAPSLLVVGAGPLADALGVQAAVLGWSCRVVTAVEEAAEAVAAFTDADALIVLDHSEAVDPVLVAAARRGRGFLGLLGSRATQAARRERLAAAGLSEEELARFSGPVGLDLGARTPGETAVSIAAEILAVRSGGSGARLTEIVGHGAPGS